MSTEENKATVRKFFELLELEGEGTTVVGLLPPDEPDAFRLAVELTAEAVRWYRETYGFFPVHQIGIIPGPRRWSGGFPLPNVFMVHRGNLADRRHLSACQLRPARWITQLCLRTGQHCHLDGAGGGVGVLVRGDRLSGHPHQGHLTTFN